MKRYFFFFLLSLFFSMTASAYQLSEWSEDMVIDITRIGVNPSNGSTVTSLRQIYLDFEGFQSTTTNLYGNTINVYKYKGTGDVNNGDNWTFTGVTGYTDYEYYATTVGYIFLNSEITEDGLYLIDVPEGQFGDQYSNDGYDNGYKLAAVTPAFQLMYTIDNQGQGSSVKFTPDPADMSTVDLLSSITITPEGTTELMFTSHEDDGSEETSETTVEAPYVLSLATNEKVAEGTLSWAQTGTTTAEDGTEYGVYDYNKLVLTLSKTIWEKGNYEVVIPANNIGIGSLESGFYWWDTELRFTYMLSGDGAAAIGKVNLNDNLNLNANYYVTPFVRIQNGKKVLVK